MGINFWKWWCSGIYSGKHNIKYFILYISKEIRLDNLINNNKFLSKNVLNFMQFYAILHQN